ncbi:hypothetical protein [Desulfococcus sp.]|uniref:hypothetical protein n=1 Tax=Desulfococcus sp. TaxID=2025834 RepID=UPI003593A887
MERIDHLKSITVQCYAGYRGEESPRQFRIGENTVAVAEIIDRWLGPDHRYFKVAGEDGGVYILRNDLANSSWELVFYSR